MNSTRYPWRTAAVRECTSCSRMRCPLLCLEPKARQSVFGCSQKVNSRRIAAQHTTVTEASRPLPYDSHSGFTNNVEKLKFVEFLGQTHRV
jgi:hypothetical protein